VNRVISPDDDTASPSGPEGGRTFFADLEEFASEHCRHGTLTADATEPAWNGYLLTVACPCGVVFGRWVTPVDATADLMYVGLRAGRLN